MPNASRASSSLSHCHSFLCGTHIQLLAKTRLITLSSTVWQSRDALCRHCRRCRTRPARYWDERITQEHERTKLRSPRQSWRLAIWRQIRKSQSRTANLTAATTTLLTSACTCAPILRALNYKSYTSQYTRTFQILRDTRVIYRRGYITRLSIIQITPGSCIIRPQSENNYIQNRRNNHWSPMRISREEMIYNFISHSFEFHLKWLTRFDR